MATSCKGQSTGCRERHKGDQSYSIKQQKRKNSQKELGTEFDAGDDYESNEDADQNGSKHGYTDEVGARRKVIMEFP